MEFLWPKKFFLLETILARFSWIYFSFRDGDLEMLRTIQLVANWAMKNDLLQKVII